MFAPCEANIDTGAAPQEFMAAMDRVRLKLPEPPDSPSLEAYVIHDYLTAARLRRDLAAPTDDLDAAIDAFLRAHAGQPVSRAVRHAWLASLAQRRRWDLFLPRSQDVTDPALSCDRLQGRLDTGDTQDLAAAVVSRWSLPQRQPSECDGVYTWARAHNLFTPALAESQARAALTAENVKFARDFLVDVPAPRAAPLLQWINLLEAPKASLSALAAHPLQPVESDALTAGFNRLSTSDSAAAAALLPLLLARPDMTPAVRGRLRRSVALGAAYDRDPGAMAAFEEVPEDAADATVQEWRVRAALWAGAFDKALVWTEQLPAAMAGQPRWRYWRARAVEMTRGAEAAAPLFGEISGDRDYYGYLAADRLHQAYRLNAQPSLDDAAAQASLAGEPGLIRAHALFDCDLVDDANAEWAAALAGAGPAVKLQAAHLASRWTWYAQTIATLAQIGEWNDLWLRYPRPFASPVADAVKLTGLPSDWIWAVMRQESLFRKDAESRANARGLMQLLPATAVAVARRWQLPIPQPDTLFDPAVAVPLGAAYLRELLDRYAGQLAPGLAAYNAGPAAVARWLPPKSKEADIWIECIPYTETRAYIQHIVEHIVAFAAVRGVEPTRLLTLLPATPEP